MLSPDSAVSEICAWEVDEATQLNKRILSVNCRPLKGASPPPHLRDLNRWYRDFVTREGSGIKTLSFYEMKPLPHFGLVVEPGDADPGVPNGGLHPLDEDP